MSPPTSLLFTHNKAKCGGIITRHLSQVVGYTSTSTLINILSSLWCDGLHFLPGHPDRSRSQQHASCCPTTCRSDRASLTRYV